MPKSIRYNSVHYGLRIYSFDYCCRAYRRRYCETINARKRSWWLYRNDHAWHRGRVCRYLDRPHVYGRELRGWLDHVDRGRNGSVVAVSTDQAQDVSMRHLV